jgi:hypothetical protein
MLYNCHFCRCYVTYLFRDRRARARMVVGFITTYAISAYYH